MGDQDKMSFGYATYPVDYEYDCYGNKIAMTTYRTVGGVIPNAPQSGDTTVGGVIPNAPQSGDTTVGGVIPNAPQQGDTTHWFYDESSGTLTNKLYADGQGPCYEYDANGRLAKRTWARGVETFYAYDGWGNLTNTTYSDNTPTIALCYDAMGRQVEAHDAAGVTTFTYDDYGALTNETVIGVAGTNVIERYYDTFGRNAGVQRDPSGGVAVVELRSGIWYNMRHETVAQLQDQPVLPSDQPHCPPRVLPE